LSLVKAIIEAHKGEVRVSSERGKGSVFTLFLPLNSNLAGIQLKSAATDSISKL
jgi:signal transduction histidine kinase